MRIMSSRSDRRSESLFKVLGRHWAMTEAAAKAILFVCPTRWDEAELPRVMATGPYRIVPFGTDVSEPPERFDALDFIEGAVAAGKAMAIDGVMASDDYPGSIVAPVIARRLDVCGPDPQSVLLCHHIFLVPVAHWSDGTAAPIM
jgi:hypothetical protein